MHCLTLMETVCNMFQLFPCNLQRKYHVEPTYMQRQPEINSKMRAILIDWLIQVHLKFNLLQETLYLTISIIDRYLQVRKLMKSYNISHVLSNYY